MSRIRRQTAQLFIRLDPASLEKLRWLAAHEGRPMANLIRHLIAVAYGQAAHTDEPPAPVAPASPTEGENTP